MAYKLKAERREYFGKEKNGRDDKTQISIRLPTELLEQIQRLAKSEHRNRSSMIEWMLSQTIKGKRHG